MLSELSLGEHFDCALGVRLILIEIKHSLIVIAFKESAGIVMAVELQKNNSEAQIHLFWTSLLFFLYMFYRKVEIPYQVSDLNRAPQ